MDVPMARAAGVGLLLLLLPACSNGTAPKLPPQATQLFWGSGASAAFVEDSVPLVLFYADSLDRPIGAPRPSVTWSTSDSTVVRILSDTLAVALDTGLVTLTATMPRSPGFALNVSFLALPRPTGRMVWVRAVTPGEEPRLVWQDFPKHDLNVVPEYSYPGGPHGRARLTADRRRAVVYAPRPVSPIANSALYLIDFPSGAATMLLDTMAGHQITPAWLPGDSLIAFLANRSGAWEVWTVRPNGTEPQLRTNLRQTRPPVFGVTPQGNLVLPLMESESGTDLYELTLIGDTIRRITHSPDTEERNPAVSPDGRTIAYATGTVDNAVVGEISQIWLVDRDGANRRRLVPARGVVAIYDAEPSPHTGGTSFPSWTPDGQFVLVDWYVDPAPLNRVGYTVLGEIYAVRPPDGRAVRLTRWPSIDAQAVFQY